MANAIKAVRNEEIGLKKSWKVYEGPKSTLKNKVKQESRCRETDQYPALSETTVAL